MHIVVPSCYRFRDVWYPWCEFRLQFWPDCPWKTVLITDRDDPERSALFDSVWTADVDLGWCRNLYDYLETIDDEHVLMTLDDMWIDGRVKTAFVHFAYGYVKLHESIGLFRLCPAPPGDDTHGQKKFGGVPKRTKYRTSTAPGIWRTDYLRRIAGFGWNTAWEFELCGEKEADRMPERVVAVHENYRPLRVIYTAVTKGIWEPGALRRAAELGIDVDTSLRRTKDAGAAG